MFFLCVITAIKDLHTVQNFVPSNFVLLMFITVSGSSKTPVMDLRKRRTQRPASAAGKKSRVTIFNKIYRLVIHSGNLFGCSFLPILTYAEDEN